MLVNCECDIYLCRECSGPRIDGADPGPSGRAARRAGGPISDVYAVESNHHKGTIFCVVYMCMISST